MSPWVSLLAGAVLGAFVSLAVAVYLQDRWKASSDRRRRLRRVKEISRSWTESDGPITIAGVPTSMYLIEGDGFLVIEPQNVRVDIRSTRAELPALVGMAREKVARQLAASRRSEDHAVSSWNSANMIALTGYQISRTAEREDATVHLNACLNDYATFAATVLRLDEELDRPDAYGERLSTTLRREFLPTSAAVAESVRRPLPFLANGVGIALLAFTDDDKVLLVHRLESRARPGEYDVTVVEGIDANFDSGEAGRLDIYATAVRGCREELGVDVSPSDVSILAFGVDMTYYQWNFLGLVDIRLTANQVMAQHAMHAKDRWEGKIEPVKLDSVSVFERLRQDKIWDCGLVTTYLALCKKLGVRVTREAADKVFGFRDRKPPWQR